MNGLARMELDDGKMFFMDGNQKIFAFDEQGKFLNTIGQIGQGPDEQLVIYDFYLDKKNKRVCVIDVYKFVLFSYTYDGKLIEKEKINETHFRNFSNAFLVKDNTLLLVKHNSPESQYNFNLVSGKNYNEVNHCVPFLFIGEISESVGYPTVTQIGDKTLISALYSDTIYRYDPETNNLIPEIVFKGKYRPITKEDVSGEKLESAMDAFRAAKEKNLSRGISNLAMTKKYLYFTAESPGDIRSVLWNKETSKGSIFNVDNDSYLGIFFIRMVYSTENAFISAISADYFIGIDWKGMESAKKVAENTIEDDNPIIVFYYLD
jgi:hypothetical protein